MLTSAKRRMLHVLSVSLAIISVGYGLILKYDTPDLDNLVVQNDLDNQEEVIQEPAAIVKASNSLTDPN